MSVSTYKIEIEAHDNVIKEVSKANDRAGSVYLPKDWIGKKVMVVLMEEAGEK